MALRDRLDDLAEAWQGWPAWRRRIFAAAAVSALAFAAWLAAGVVEERDAFGIAAASGTEAGLPAVASAAAPSGGVAGFGAGEALPDAAREAALEQALAGKARALLERIVGEGRVAVQVRAELDWSRREATRERFDPDGQVERSEERTTEPPGARASGRSTERVEYDVSKDVTHEVTPGGEIRRLHVAVLLDDRKLGAAGTAVPDLAQLEVLAKQAVGFSPARGDVFSLVRIPFHAAWPDSDIWPSGGEDWLPLAGLLVALVLGALAFQRGGARLAEAPQLPMTAAALEAALLQGGAASLAVSAAEEIAGAVGPGGERDAAAAALRAWLTER